MFRIYTVCKRPGGTYLAAPPERGHVRGRLALVTLRTLFLVLPLLAGTLLLDASTATADRTQVYSVQGVDCADCGTPIKSGLKKLKGVKKSAFDIHKVEITVTMDNHVTDQAVLDVITRSGHGFKGIVGPGQGAYLPLETYPKGADVVVLTES